MTSESESASRLLQVAADRGMPLYAGFQRRFDPSLAAVKEAVESGMVGDLTLIRTIHFDHYNSRPLRSFEDIFTDMLVHDIELVTWIAERSVIEVFASAVCRGADREYGPAGTTAASVMLTLNGGVLGSVAGSTQCPGGEDTRLEVLGSRMQAAVGLGPLTPTIPFDAQSESITRGIGYGSFRERFADAFVFETANFCSFALGLTESFRGCTGQEAVLAQRVAEACGTSANLRAPVVFSPPLIN